MSAFQAERLLIVEDSAQTRQGLRKIFLEMGFKHIHDCVNGEQALAFLRTSADEGKPVGLVFCDIWMPEMNGIDLLRFVREDSRLMHTPFIMVTTESNKPIVVKAVMSGISGYIVKPFSVDDIKAKVHEVFSGASQSIKENA